MTAMTRRSAALLAMVLAFAFGPHPMRAGAASSVRAELVLASSRVAAGSSVRGTLVLTNPGERAVNLNEGCRPQWVVVLGRGPKPPGVAFSLVCAPEPFRVAPGTTKLPFRVATGRRRPGRYRAFLVASQPSFPTVAPVKVRIVRAS
jgi:hypothetical protein